jgi:hypothetical protein
VTPRAQEIKRPVFDPTLEYRYCDFVQHFKSIGRAKEGFTLLIGTWDRFRLVAQQIQYYSQSPLVTAIVITLHNPKSVAPAPIKLRDTVVFFEVPETDTLSNRFNPSLFINTECVLMIDDDMRLDLRDLPLLYSAWRHHPRNLISFSPRWPKMLSNGHFSYRYGSQDPSAGVASPAPGYRLALTKNIMFHRDYLELYACERRPEHQKFMHVSWNPEFEPLRQAIHKTVSAELNCEDIGLNYIVAASLSQMAPNLRTSTDAAAPLAVVPLHPLGDFGKESDSALHARGGHVAVRSECLNAMGELFYQVAHVYLPEQMRVILSTQLTEQVVSLANAPYQGYPQVIQDCLSEDPSGPCSWSAPTPDLLNMTIAFQSM